MKPQITRWSVLSTYTMSQKLCAHYTLGVCYRSENMVLKLKYIHHYFFLKFLTKKSQCILRAGKYGVSPICDKCVTTQNVWFFRRDWYKGFEVLKFSTSATTTQLLSSGKFCKPRYATIPVKSASANVSFYTSNSKMSNFELWHSCRKWAI